MGTAKELSSKVESNELAAGELLKQCETLQHQLKAMRQVLCLILSTPLKMYRPLNLNS